MKKWYDEYHKKYFNNEIPSSDNILFEVSKTKGTWGDCSLPQPKTNNKFRIRLSVHFIREEIAYRETMIHEMIHVYCKLKYYEWGHGRHFKETCNLINKDGWNLSRTTARAKSDKVEVLTKYDVILWRKDKDNEKIYVSKIMRSKVSFFKAWLNKKNGYALIAHTMLAHQDLEEMTYSRSRLHYKSYEKKELIKKFPQLKYLIKK